MLTLIVSGVNESRLSSLAHFFKKAPSVHISVKCSGEGSKMRIEILLAPFSASFFLKKICALGWDLSASI